MSVAGATYLLAYILLNYISKIIHFWSHCSIVQWESMTAMHSYSSCFSARPVLPNLELYSRQWITSHWATEQVFNGLVNEDTAWWITTQTINLPPLMPIEDIPSNMEFHAESWQTFHFWRTLTWKASDFQTWNLQHLTKSKITYPNFQRLVWFGWGVHHEQLNFWHSTVVSKRYGEWHHVIVKLSESSMLLFLY